MFVSSVASLPARADPAGSTAVPTAQPGQVRKLSARHIPSSGSHLGTIEGYLQSASKVYAERSVLVPRKRLGLSMRFAQHQNGQGHNVSTLYAIFCSQLLGGLSTDHYNSHFLQSTKSGHDSEPAQRRRRVLQH